MKKFFLLFMVLACLSACSSDDDAVEIKDYDLQTFEADLKYDSEAGHGTVAYTQQVYFKFGEISEVETGEYGTDSWNQFYLLQDSVATNYTSDVSDWDLVFTNYTANLGTDEAPMEYNVTGVLINTEEEIVVGLYEYTDSEDSGEISAAFAGLNLDAISSNVYSDDIDVIGYDWKPYDRDAGMYTVATNEFYLVRLKSGDTYKLRFVGFYGDTTAERIIKIEYQLME